MSAASKKNIAELAALELQPNVCAVKVFAGSSTGDLLVEDDASLEAVMRSGRRRIAYHSEDEYRLQERKPLFQSGMPHRNHMVWRDVECAFLGTRRLMALARKTGRPAHILHVSTAEELDYLKDFRDVCTVEVLLNHLTQTDEAYDRLGGYAVMNPPIRDARHMAAAWAAVADGTVDVVGSDHAPHSRAAKERPWPDCAAGLTGMQTIVPLMLDHVSAGRLSLSRLVDLMCAGPARVYGVTGKGRLAAGYDADFTLVDMRKQRRHRGKLDRLALRLDALRRAALHRLADDDDHARRGGDAGGRGDRRAARRGGALRRGAGHLAFRIPASAGCGGRPAPRSGSPGRPPRRAGRGWRPASNRCGRCCGCRRAAPAVALPPAGNSPGRGRGGPANSPVR